MTEKESSSKLKEASKAIRRQPTQSRMRAQGVIKSLNVGKNIVLSLSSCHIVLQMYQFRFQTTEEILRNSIIVWISFSGHTLTEPGCIQPLPVGSCRVLDAPVAVEDQARRGTLPVDSHVQNL